MFRITDTPGVLHGRHICLRNLVSVLHIFSYSNFNPIVCDTMTALSPYRDAIRILFILVKGSTFLNDSGDSNIVAVFKGEARLHACDFWMRYPDYLAEELLDRFEKRGDINDLEAVRSIFSEEEPELRKFPMIRYRFGAYEKIDNSMSVLRARELIAITRKVENDVIKETDFIIHKSAFFLTTSIVNEWPPLCWYAKRAELVADIAGQRGGTELKDRQYKQVEYATTHSGGIIPSISLRVKERYENIVRHTKA